MLNYTITGKDNSAIIYVHGNSQSSVCWQKVIENNVLQSSYTQIAIDLPGHGHSFRSIDPDVDYSGSGMGMHVLKCITHLKCREYILVANSLGSNIIGEIVPELVNCKGIVLIGSSAFGYGLKINDVLQDNPNMVACFMETPSNEQIHKLINDTVNKVPEELKQFIKTQFERTDPKVRMCLGASFAAGDYSDQVLNLKNCKIPVAVLYGEQEKICYPFCLDRIAFPKWKDKTILIPESGHFCHLDQPEKTAELIVEFAATSFK